MKALTNIGRLSLLTAACVALAVEIRSLLGVAISSQGSNLFEELYFALLLVLPYIILFIVGSQFQGIDSSSFMAAVICAISMSVLICTLYVYLNLIPAYVDERGRSTYTFVVNFGILLLAGGVGLMALGLLVNWLRRGGPGRAA